MCRSTMFLVKVLEDVILIQEAIFESNHLCIDTQET